MLAVVGTVPEEDFPLLAGTVRLEHGLIRIADRSIPVNRGTPALLAACVRTGEALGLPPPFAYLVGDVGRGAGSRRLYRHLADSLAGASFKVLAFHYLLPDVDWHNRILFAVQAMAQRPLLIADAGFMYAAKMSGEAQQYDLFTPDLGELAFLADEQAPHPFYTRGFILHEDNQAPELIARAYRHGNAARCLLVKGGRDFVVCRGEIKAVIDQPSVKALEAIGGTGDTLTGIVAALISDGKNVGEAALAAARINRLAGAYAEPTPATQVHRIIDQITRAAADILNKTDKPAELSKGF